MPVSQTSISSVKWKDRYFARGNEKNSIFFNFFRYSSSAENRKL